MEDEGGGNYSGQRGEPRERRERRRQAATPRVIPSHFSAPLILPFFRPPSLVFSIPSEVTTACMNKRRYRAARGLATATPLEVTLTCWERGRKDKGRGYSGQRGEPRSRAKGSGIPLPLAFCGSCFRSPRLPAYAPPSSFHPL